MQVSRPIELKWEHFFQTSVLTAALEISTFLPGAGGDNDSYFHPPQPTSSHLPQPQTEADITIFANMTSQAVNECEPCELNQERGYVIYSAVFSFYAPMLVMMFFNWRIFRTANKTTKAIRQGWTKVKGAEGADIGKRHAEYTSAQWVLSRVFVYIAQSHLIHLQPLEFWLIGGHQN